MILLICLKMACPLKSINDSLISNLNGFDSNIKIEKPLNKPTWSKKRQWSLTVDFLLLSTGLPVTVDRL